MAQLKKIRLGPSEGKGAATTCVAVAPILGHARTGALPTVTGNGSTDTAAAVGGERGGGRDAAVTPILAA